MSSNMNNINYNDYKNICRSCMLNCDVKFTPTNEMSDVFYKLTNIHFETNDNLPQQICLKCFDKIIDIQEFASRCKQTHTTLKECLNNLEKIRSNKQHNKNKENINDLQTILSNKVTIVQHEAEGVDDNSLNLSDNYQMEIKEEIIEETNDNIIPEKSEINYDLNTNCFEDDLLIPNTFDNVLEEDKKTAGLAPVPEAVCKQRRGKPLNRGQKIMAYNVYMSHIYKGESKSKCVKVTASEIGVSESSVWAIIRERETTGELASPSRTKSRPQAEEKLDEAQKSVLRRLVHSFFSRDECPTLSRLVEAVRFHKPNSIHV